MRLVELAAAGIHQIAAILFQPDDKIHTKEHIHAVHSWKKEPEWVDMAVANRVSLNISNRPQHRSVTASTWNQQYPHGLADVAGYWAEDRILRGIAVFDRDKSGTEVRCP